MFRTGMFVCAVVLVLGDHASAQETTGSKPGQPQKQRVSPKVLREAMALPEFKARNGELTPSVSIDDLKNLADRLKAKGSSDDAELLQRFIHEHERLTAAVASSATSNGSLYQIHCEVIDVNADDLAKDSVLHSRDLMPKLKEAEAELHDLLGRRKAKLAREPMVLSAHANETANLSSGGQFAVPVPDAEKKVKPEFRNYGLDVQTKVTPVAGDFVQLHLTVDVSEKDSENAITIAGTQVPGVTRRKLQTTLKMKLGEPMIHRSQLPKGLQEFVVVRVTQGE